MRGAKSRRALPGTEEKIGEVFYTVIKSDCGKREVQLWLYRWKYGCGGGLVRMLWDVEV